MDITEFARLVAKAGIDTRIVARPIEESFESAGVKAMLERLPDFKEPSTALFAAIFADKPVYDVVDRAIDRRFAFGVDVKLETIARNSLRAKGLGRPDMLPEVIIGSGITAAIYACNRVLAGYPKPIVLEKSPRAGGTFGMTRNPAFWLNSRNRPGELGVPGSRGALNVLPGAVVQPADLSGDEYQPNNALGWAVRTTLLTCANVLTGVDVENLDLQFVDDYRTGGVSRSDYYPYVQVTGPDGGQSTIYTRRVVVATGLGDVRRTSDIDVESCNGGYSYSSFMKRMDEPFPFRGVQRVAVIGAGDGGKTVIEALTGQGPNLAMTAASLDYLDSIDWYGVPQTQQDREGWREANRSRYDGIGRLLPRRVEVSGTVDQDDVERANNEGDFVRFNSNAPVRRDYYRVFPTQERVSQVQEGYNGQILVNGRRYDMVIDARGYQEARVTSRFTSNYDIEPLSVGNRIVGNKSRNYPNTGPVILGVASQLPNDDGEAIALPRNIPENSVAVFRYADRTAQAAQQLD